MLYLAISAVKMLRDFAIDARTRAHIKNRFPDITLERNVLIKGPMENLTLGRSVIIQSGSVLHLGGMDWCEDKGSISIGEGGVISPNCILYGCGPGGIDVGKGFDCGPNVGIFASRINYRASGRTHVFGTVSIGDDVVVFANSVIGPGVSIGHGAVVAACSVVTRDIPPDTLAAGAPARIVMDNLGRALGKNSPKPEQS